MYKQCATEESARRQRQLEQCLQELMLSSEYNQITVGDICDRAGISRKSFYRYFNSKEDCLYALMDHALFDGASFYLPAYTDFSSQQITHERFFRYWKEQHNLLSALTRNNLTVLLVERMLVYSNQEERAFRSAIPGFTGDAHERNLFYIGGIMTLIIDWHRSGYQKSIFQMSKILSDLNV